LRSDAEFADGDNAFVLTRNPFPKENIHPGPYRAGRNVEDANLYRVGHPLAQRIIEQCKALTTEPTELVFQYSSSGKNISILDSLVGRAGWLAASAITVTAFETEDHVLLAGCTDDGVALLPDQCKRLFSLAAVDKSIANLSGLATAQPAIQSTLDTQRKQIVAELSDKNAQYFEAELDKLDRWGEDKRNSLKIALKELEEQIKSVRRGARLAPNLPEKLKLEREKRLLDTKRDEAWKEYEQAAKEVESRKDALMDEIERRLEQQVTEERLFSIRWTIV
jgi:hypothetical protein